VNLKTILKTLSKEIQDRDVENMKLRLSKEFELKIKDMEKDHSERIHTTKSETRKAFDYTMENMKNIYEDEIKA
jgi:hypothetical protein